MPKKKRKKTQKEHWAELRKTMPRRKSLFWDVDPKTIDPKKHAKYIIERILDFGYDDEVRWLGKSYNKRIIGTIVNKSRVVHASTKTLWQTVLKHQ